MRRAIISGLLVLPVLVLCAVPASAQLSELTADDLRLLYFEATQGYLAPHVVRCFANSMDFQRALWGYTPTEPVTVFLSDFSDRGNASAGAVPRNSLMLEISPLGFAYETVAPNERINWLMNHELVHVATLDQATGSDRTFRKLFQGKVSPTADHPESILYFYLTAPRDAVPRWYQEGIAVFVETWMAGGLGRAQGAWDEMVFRSMVRDGSRFYDPLGLVSEGTKIDFQVEVNSYLYGTRFMSYLAYRHGPESLVEWVSRGDGSRAYYASQFEQVFGQRLSAEWQQWIDWEQEFQRANLDALSEYPITSYQDLSSRAFGSVSRAYFDAERQKVYAGFNYPGVVAHVGSISIEDGSVEKLVDIKGPVIYAVTSLAYDAEGGTLFYTTDNLDHRDVRAVDPVSGETNTLLKDERIGDLGFNPADRSLWGVRHFNGIATLVRIPYPWDQWHRVHSWPYGTVMYDLDISPDGRLLSASIGEIDGRHSLWVMETEALLEGESTPVARRDFEYLIPSNFVFSPDGRYLYGSSYYTGVSNIVRYDLASGELDTLTNTDTGFFRPIPMEDGSLIVFRYTGDGFVPTTIEVEPLEDVNPITFFGRQIIDTHPVVEEWNVGSPMEIEIDDLNVSEGEYHGFRSIGLESLYPIVQGYKDSAAIGLAANFSDPMMLNRAKLAASYSPDESLSSSERLHAHFDYRRYDWRVDLRYNYADFYDLFGPTKTSLKGYSAGVGYEKTLIFDQPRKMQLDVYGVFYGDLERLPDYQNVPSPYDELFRAYLRLDYSNVRRSLGSVDGEKGIRWELTADNSYVNGDLVPTLRGDLDFGFALPIRHSSIWLRSSAGAGFGDKDDPFANFFFGGFGNNYVDHREEKRYREWYGFPGVDLNELDGRTYLKSMLEWNLPPLRFESVGWPGFYLSWARTALFGTGIVTDPDLSEEKSEVANVGVQVDLRFTVLSRLNMTLSLGYATAFESGFEPRDEWMISLKIL